MLPCHRLLLAVTLTFSFAITAYSAPKVVVGYMPIMADAQAFVILGGQTRQTPLAGAKLIEFQDGPDIVQAILAGQVEVAYLGVGPTMVARAKGADIRIVAADDIASGGLVAVGDLAHYFESGSAQTAFARFTKDKGRKPVITTFPRGSVPGAVLQYWLRKVVDVDPASVNIIYQGAAQAQQSLLTGAADAGVIPEPTSTIVTMRRPDARVVVDSAAMFPNQPGAVLVVSEKLIRQDPAYIEALVAAQIEATALLRDHPEQVVPAVRKYMGGGRLPADVVLQSLRNTHGSFTADPHQEIESTKKLHDFQVEQGTLTSQLNVNELFDTRFYDRQGK
ncbi:MAG: ABC transporter substrate-binding protein [Candidimonas sp.]|nr:MAG: ABC transporter substrate-binding protein [Candidimonas sp.]